MTGMNHALTGGLLAKYLPAPIALPLALASHFILDSLPHYGIPHKQRDKSWFWRIFFTCDFIITLSFAILQIKWHHYIIFLGGFLGMAPDLIWVGQVTKDRSFKLRTNTNRYTRWHAKIQRYERPWGIWIEIPVALVLFYFVFLTPY
jgi:hypothetical protein